MFIRSEPDCQPFVANDGCNIIELLHPKQAEVVNNLKFSLAIAEVEVGKETYHHFLEQDEVYYLLAGEGLVYVDAEIARVVQGDAVFIAAGSVQWIRNTGPSVLRFAAIVSPPWTEQGDHLIAPDEIASEAK